jgi:hypothetical protein
VAENAANREERAVTSDRRGGMAAIFRGEKSNCVLNELCAGAKLP